MKISEKKLALRKDTVSSDSFHVGIELELKVAGENGSGEHDHEGCEDNYREMIRGEGALESLMNDFNLSRDTARSLEQYFDFDQWVENRMDGWSCDDSECSYISSGDAESTRDELEERLKCLVQNKSIKVVSDSSISTNDDEVDAEVCWNYFASKETIQDNEKILNHLKSIGAKFDTSCGLHINLNNYLSVPEFVIETSDLGFLFDFVGPSRRKSNYCNNFGMSKEKYSMIYNQGDRLEFRFFSPTLEAVKLNHYVTLANTVYRRLAGKNAKLPKKTADYFLNKMVALNGLSNERAQSAIDRVNTMIPASAYAPKPVMTESEFDSAVNMVANNTQRSLYGSDYIAAASQLNSHINEHISEIQANEAAELEEESA